MSHEMSVRSNGTVEAVFGFGEHPWWDKDDMPARVLDGPIHFHEIFEGEGPFSWHADFEQLQYADGALSSQHGIRRSDTKAELGVHSGSYGNIQPRKLFDFCAAFFAAHHVPISSAIAMKGGKVLNISARLGEIDILGSGDIHKSYLCFANSFDGSLKAQVYKSLVQPVCMNTTIAGISSADFTMEYKHTKHVESRIAADTSNAAALMLAQAATDERVKLVLETLAQRKPTKKAYEAILDELFGDSKATATKNIKANVTDLVSSGVNAVAFPDFRGTGYGVYTAITDYADHKRPVRLTTAREGMTSDQIRVETSLIGEGANLKKEALKVLEKVLVLADGTYEDSPYTSLPPRDVTPRYLPTVDASYTSPTDTRLGYGSEADTQDPWEYNATVSDDMAEQHLNYYDAQERIEETIDDMSRERAEYYADLAQETQPTDTVVSYLYTTADITVDLPGTSTERVIEQISPIVALRRVSVSQSSLQAQIDAYKASHCLAETVGQWLRRGKGE